MTILGDGPRNHPTGQAKAQSGIHVINPKEGNRVADFLCKCKSGRVVTARAKLTRTSTNLSGSVHCRVPGELVRDEQVGVA